MTDRERYLRERITTLREEIADKPMTRQEILEHARFMCCDPEDVPAYFKAANKARQAQREIILRQLERDLAELTKPYVAPLPKPTKPRRK